MQTSIMINPLESQANSNVKGYELHSDLIALLAQLKLAVSKANCLNQLRTLKIDFINLGNIVYCPHQNLMLIFKSYALYAYDFIEKFNKNSI